ncbi:hypothetical protein QM1_2475 [Clostridioides difficile DA00212]|nr:hypothetical protein QM1_2475 [Clostridioides difficile DA00212]
MYAFTFHIVNLKRSSDGYANGDIKLFTFHIVNLKQTVRSEILLKIS